MSRKEMVRYGRVLNSRKPKNTLVTVRDDDTVYFGISRCRIDEEPFNKSQGVKLAKLRVGVAQSKPSTDWIVDGSFHLHKSGLFGEVSVDEVPKLLSHFNNVDKWCKEVNK